MLQTPQMTPNNHMLPRQIFGRMLRPNFGPSLLDEQQSINQSVYVGSDYQDPCQIDNINKITEKKQSNTKEYTLE